MLSLRVNSISFKNTLSYFLLTIINISLFTLMIFENQTDLISQNLLLNTESTATNVKIRVDNIIITDLKKTKTLNKAFLQKVSSTLKVANITDYSIFTENLKLIAEYKKSKKIKKSRKVTKTEINAIIRATKEAQFDNRAFSTFTNRKKNKIDIYVPFVYGGEESFIIKASYDLSEMDKQMTYLYKQVLIIALMVMLIHLISALILTRTLIKPIQELSDYTRLICNGELKSRVNILRNDEIGELARNFNEMAIEIERMQVEAKGSNPLTGLPGNITIAQEIDFRLNAKEEFAIIYVDLDNFKAYNDKYGFTRGDDAILYTRDCLIEAAKSKGNDRTFVGHEGGDDFVVLTTFDNWEVLCQTILQFFDHDVKQFYNSADSKNESIQSIDRQGNKMIFPLMSLTLAVVSNVYRTFSSHVDMVSVAAEVKKRVKKLSGSNYGMDMRKK